MANASTPISQRRGLRFTLRTLLIVTCASSLVLGWLGSLLVRRLPLRPNPTIARLYSLDGRLLDRGGLLFGQRSLADSEWWSLPKEGSLAEFPGVSLGKANLTDNDLRVLANLPGLWSLVIKDGSGVTDNGLAHLAGAARLKNLSLCNTSITATGLSRLPAREHIEVLRLGGLSVNDAALANLCELTNLRTLWIRGSTSVTDNGLAHLANLERLQSLYLYQTAVTDRGLLHLSGLTQLRDLTLREAGVSDAGMEHLAGLVELRALSLGETNVGDAGVAWLVHLENLGHLNLQPTAVTDAGLESLAKLQNLKHLSLGPNVSRAGAERLKSALPQCEIWFWEGHNWSTLK